MEMTLGLLVSHILALIFFFSFIFLSGRNRDSHKKKGGGVQGRAEEKFNNLGLCFFFFLFFASLFSYFDPLPRAMRKILKEGIQVLQQILMVFTAQGRLGGSWTLSGHLICLDSVLRGTRSKMTPTRLPLSSNVEMRPGLVLLESRPRYKKGGKVNRRGLELQAVRK